MRIARRWLTPSLVTLALLGLAAALWLAPAHIRAAGKAPPADTPLALLWTRPVAGFRGAALSPQGEMVALASGTGGAISLWHWRVQPDRPLWVHPATGADSVDVSAAGAFVVAWSAMNPTRTDFTILRGEDGVTLSHRNLDGAIWDAQLSADGYYAGAVTGGKTLHLYTLSDQPYGRDFRDDSRIHRPWSLGGIGDSLDFTTLGSYLVTGSWDESGVACYTPRGACLWRYPEDTATRQNLSDRLFTTQLSGSGRYVLGVSYGNVRECDPVLYLWRSDGGGNPLWKTELGEDAFYPTAQISADGRIVAVSYLRQIVRGDQSLSEHRLRVLDNQGSLLWERGGLLFSPTLVALGPDGRSIIVSDGARTLYALNPEGRIVASYALPGILRRAVVSSDRRTVLVYTGDGTLSLFRLG